MVKEATLISPTPGIVGIKLGSVGVDGDVLPEEQVAINIKAPAGYSKIHRMADDQAIGKI